MTLPIVTLRRCLDAAIYPTIATCSAEGVPNVALLSYIRLIDADHVALSFRFLDKTARNVAANPRVSILLMDAVTCRQHVLDLAYERTETEGPLYDEMRVRFDARAALSGLSGAVKPAGVQVYRAVGYRATDPGYVPEPTQRVVSANAVQLLTAEIGACEDLQTLLQVALDGLAEHLGIEQSIVLLADPGGERLYAIASHGYPQSGAGAEVTLGEGLIGVVASERRPIRIDNARRDQRANAWVRDRAAQAGAGTVVERTIPLVGLEGAQSLLAVPMLARNRLVGVLYVESLAPARFLEDDEKTLIALAGQLGTAILLCSQSAELPVARDVVPAHAAPGGAPLLVRRFEFDQSVFFGDDYVIKGVAGAILWKLLAIYTAEGRTEFSNRELRLDRSLGLPEIGDNLEARLVLLLRRLADRDGAVRLEKAGRGRVRLIVSRPLDLRSIARA